MGLLDGAIVNIICKNHFRNCLVPHKRSSPAPLKSIGILPFTSEKMDETLISSKF